MSWLDRLLPGQFRGVDFQVIESNKEHGGRRYVDKRYPDFDGVTSVDIGEDRRAFTVVFLVMGDNYDLDRNRMVAALRKRGPADLVHPYRGAVTVLTRRWTVEEIKRTGRVAQFTVEFQLVPDPAAAPPTDHQSEVASKVAIVRTEAAEVTASLDTTGPEKIRAFLEDQVTTVGRTIQQLDVFTGVARDVNRLAKGAASLVDDAAALVLSPLDLALSVREGVEAIYDAARSFEAAFEAYEDLADLITPQFDYLGSGNGDTSTRVQSNATGLGQQVRATAFAGWCQAASVRSWGSEDEAQAALDRIATWASTEAYTLPDALRASVQAALYAIARALPPVGLPRLERQTVRSTTSTLWLAYNRYGSAARADEIKARNVLRFPVMVPGGTVLEVLSE